MRFDFTFYRLKNRQIVSETLAIDKNVFNYFDFTDINAIFLSIRYLGLNFAMKIRQIDCLVTREINYTVQYLRVFIMLFLENLLLY